jgi:hypothetical protein
MTSEIPDILNAIQLKLKTVQNHLEGYEDCTERILCGRENHKSKVIHMPTIQFKLDAMKRDYQSLMVPEHEHVMSA